MKTKLTDAKVRNTPPDPKRRLYLWDTEVTGLGVMVTPAGARSYLAKYDLAGGGRSRKVTLGRVDALRLRDARELARDIRREAARGGDPAADRKRAARAPTLREVYLDFMRELEGKRSRNTLREYGCIFEKWVLPALGSGPAAKITFADVAALHRRVGRRSPIQANRLVKVLGRVLDYAQRVGAYPAELRNPARGVERYPEDVTTGRAITEEEARALWEALELEDSRQAAAIRAVLLAGLRPAEIRLLTWGEVDAGGRVLRLKKSKTGARVAYIGPHAAAIIEDQPRLDSCVFAGRAGRGPYFDLAYLWNRVRDRAGLPGLRLYDAGRHTFASVAAEVVGLPEDRIGRLLGHSRGGGTMTSRYIHTPDSSLLRDAERVERELWSRFTGQEAGGGRVVSIRGRKGG